MTTKYGSSVYLCNTCGELKRSEEFYKSSNPLHYEGVIPMCKTCIKANMTDDESAQNTLRVIDRPFIKEIWDNANNGTGCRIGRYFQILGTSKYKAMSYADSNFGDDNVIDSKGNEISDDEIGKLQDEWGFGYSPREYHYFEKKYQSLKANYPVNTSLHTEALRTYCVYKVKAEMATASGDVKDAKMWGEMAQKQGEIAKINLNKLNKSDLSQGLDSFSELARMVEKEVDIIPILPKFIEKPHDKIDFAIWCYVNYERKLHGLPEVDYDEIYNFYQDKLKEHQANNNELAPYITEVEITTTSGIKKKILTVDIQPIIEKRKAEYPDNNFIQNLDKWVELVSYLRFFPDAFYDLIMPENGGMRLDADQRMLVRGISRFQKVMGVYSRGFGKTALNLMVNYHTAIFFPDIDLTLTAQTKENASALIEEKYRELIRFYPLLENELLHEPKISKDKAEVKFKSGGILDTLSNTQSSKGKYVCPYVV